MKCIGSILLLLTAVSCQKNYSENILGQWQVDSVATFYNGFTYESSAQHWEETYQYDSVRVAIRRPDGSQSLMYRIDQDTLYYLDQQQLPVSQFTIVRLTDEQLILLKEQPPLWEGPEQTRYEIRYFSKEDNPSLTTRVSP